MIVDLLTVLSRSRRTRDPRRTRDHQVPSYIAVAHACRASNYVHATRVHIILYAILWEAFAHDD